MNFSLVAIVFIWEAISSLMDLVHIVIAFINNFNYIFHFFANFENVFLELFLAKVFFFVNNKSLQIMSTINLCKTSLLLCTMPNPIFLFKEPCQQEF